MREILLLTSTRNKAYWCLLIWRCFSSSSSIIEIWTMRSSEVITWAIWHVVRNWKRLLTHELEWITSSAFKCCYVMLLWWYLTFKVSAPSTVTLLDQVCVSLWQQRESFQLSPLSVNFLNIFQVVQNYHYFLNRLGFWTVKKWKAGMRWCISEWRMNSGKEAKEKKKTQCDQQDLVRWARYSRHDI